ncbi:monocarboxylate transporter 12-like [Bacillus rossius redtenbacheri]|uniref:monocarboxylate transporter 12-like n=1 Tax=Bacillus rossius redtenbacheri TaxID=93214 RepID=UPI002FDE3EB0
MTTANHVASRRRTEPPDGGWGWMVAAGVAITNMTNQSIISVFGLLFADTLQNMGYATTGAAFITNIMGAVTNFSGLVTGPVIRRYSYRKGALVGGLLTASGMVLTSEVTSIWHMIFSYSFLTGLGLGFLAPCTFVAVNTYFTTKKGRAVGLSLAGTGMGQMLYPQLVTFLLGYYGFSGTVLLLGGLSLHALVGVALFQPVERHLKVPQDAEVDLLSVEEKPPLPAVHTPAFKMRRNVSSVSLASVCSTEMGDVVIDDDHGKTNGGAGSEGALSSCWERVVHMMDLDLLRDPVFVNLVVGLAMATAAGINFHMMFPLHLHMAAGFSLSDTASCMSTLAVFDIVSRLAVPQVTDRLRASSRVTFLAAALLLVATRSALAEVRDYTTILAVSAACGFVRGVTVVNLNLAISENCPKEKLPAALGISMVLKGTFILTFGPLLGILRDKTGSFPICIHILSAMILVPMLCWIAEMVITRSRR